MKRKSKKTNCGWWLALGLLGAATAASAEIIPLAIRSRALASGPQVLLRDLAQSVAGLPEQWADRAVLKAPLPGKPQQVPLATIAYALQQYPDMAEVSLRGELQVTVQRDGIPLARQELEDLLGQYVAQDERWQQAQTEVTLEESGVLPLVSPKVPHTLEVVRAAEEGGRRTHYTFEIALRENGELIRTFPAYARVLTLEDFWVAAQPLPRGCQLGPEHLRTKLLPSDHRLRGGIPATEDITGFALSRNINLDQPISRHYLQQPLCAERGEYITVYAQRGLLNVSMRARALSDARLHEQVLCMNDNSNRRLLVKMTGAKEATIDAQGARP